MRCFTFSLICYCLCVSGDCYLDFWKTSVINKSEQELYNVVQPLKSDNTTVNHAVKGDLNDGLIESKSFDAVFTKGKQCLKNINKCFVEDTTYHTTAFYLTSYLFRRVPPFTLNSVEGVSQECQEASQKFVEDLSKFEYWALQMYDASAKIPSGLLSGNVLHFGDFDLCMQSKHQASNIYGQYCLANIQFETPKSDYLAGLYNIMHAHGIFRSRLNDSGHRVPRFSNVQWALCVPDSCSPGDVDIALRKVLKNIFNGTEIEYNTLVSSELCSSSKPSELPISTIIGGLVFISIIALEIFATFYEIYWPNDKREIILAFSLKNSFKDLTSIKKNDDIDAIHIVRFVNGLMLMAAHRSMANLFVPYINRTALAEDLGASWTVVGRAASLYTDPFIMMSGTLTAYSLFGRLNKSQGINIIGEYTSRILRILPTFIALIMFCTLVLPWTDAGPLWKSVVTHHSEVCKQHWWRNVLFIHNYFGFENMCLTHTHHIGIDTQLFFVSPFLILLLWKWPKRGIFALLTIGGISTCMRYYSTYTRNLANYVYYGASTEQLFRTADYMYIIPVYRLTVYVMGIALGYMLRRPSATFKKVHIHVGNVLAVICFCLAFIAPSFMGHFDYVYSRRDAAWYAAYAPIFWCLCFAWFIYITHMGYRGYANIILRNPIPKYWTKISYTVYLTQFPIFFYNVGTTKHTDDYGFLRKHLNLLEAFWVVFFSLVLTLLFEIPSQNIRNYIFRKQTSKLHVSHKAQNGKQKTN